MACCRYVRLASREISTTVQEFVTVSCMMIQKNEGHIQRDNQLIQEAIHPLRDGSQHGK